MNKLKEYKEFFSVDQQRQRIEKLERQLYLVKEERNEWRDRCKKLIIEAQGGDAGPMAWTIVIDSNGRFNYERTS